MTENIENKIYEKRSKKTLFQIQLGYLLTNMTGIVWGYLQFFYTTVVLLPIQLFMVANVIFIIYNAINDPIIGHYTDKSTRFVDRWGKRFPWIVIGIIGTGITLMLVFLVPIPNPTQATTSIFIWLLITLILNDTFYALFFVNLASIFQYKVRDDADRRISGGFLIVAGSIGMILPTIFLPLIVELMGRSTIFAWTIQAMVFGAVYFIILLIMIPAIRETKEMKAHWAEIGTRKKTSFVKAFIAGLKLRSFDAYIISSLLYAVTTTVTMATLPFFVVYVLGMDLTGGTLPMLLFLLAVPASSPIWIKLGNKWGSRKVYILGFFLMIPFYLPFLWIQNYILIIILFLGLGIVFGAQSVMQHPIDANVIEEACTVTEARNEGIYNGVQTFIVTFAGAAQVLLIGGVQLLTGFDPEATIQGANAVLGIRLLLSLVPIIVLTIGGLLFWLLYDITPEKVCEIEEKLKELGL